MLLYCRENTFFLLYITVYLKVKFQFVILGKVEIKTIFQ